jgi:hypothetical protein
MADTQLANVFMAESPSTVVDSNGIIYSFYQGVANNGLLWYSKTLKDGSW